MLLRLSRTPCRRGREQTPKAALRYTLTFCTSRIYHECKSLKYKRKTVVCESPRTEANYQASSSEESSFHILNSTLTTLQECFKSITPKASGARTSCRRSLTGAWPVIVIGNRCRGATPTSSINKRGETWPFLANDLDLLTFKKAFTLFPTLLNVVDSQGRWVDIV